MLFQSSGGAREKVLGVGAYKVPTVSGVEEF